MAKITTQQEQQIIQDFLSKTYLKKQIAERNNCSVDTVNRVLERNRLKEIKLSSKNEKIKDEVINSFLNGEYCKDIAIKFNIDEHSVYRILDTANIKRQSGYHSNCKLDYFKEIDTPAKAYLLGFITADGAIVNNILSIEVHKDDVQVLEYAKQEINPQATLTPTRDCIKVTFSAKQLAYDLEKFGIVQNKSKTIKQVPVNLIPSDLLHFYFRGLIDGDGCIHKDGKISIYSGSYDFIQDVQNCLVKYANVSQLSIYSGTTYFISWGSKQDKKKLFDYIYKDLNACFYYDRKYQRLKNNLQVNTEVIS